MPHRHIQYPHSRVNALLRITSVIHLGQWGPGLVQRYPVWKEDIAICIVEFESDLTTERVHRDGPKYGVSHRLWHSTTREKIIVDPSDLHAIVRIGNVFFGGRSIGHKSKSSRNLAPVRGLGCGSIGSAAEFCRPKSVPVNGCVCNLCQSSRGLVF